MAMSEISTSYPVLISLSAILYRISIICRVVLSTSSTRRPGPGYLPRRRPRPSGFEVPRPHGPCGIATRMYPPRSAVERHRVRGRRSVLPRILGRHEANTRFALEQLGPAAVMLEHRLGGVAVAPVALGGVVAAAAGVRFVGHGAGYGGGAAGCAWAGAFRG